MCVSKWLLLHLHSKSPTGNTPAAHFNRKYTRLGILGNVVQSSQVDTLQNHPNNSIITLGFMIWFIFLLFPPFTHTICHTLCKCLISITSFNLHSHPVGCVYFETPYLSQGP